MTPADEAAPVVPTPTTRGRRKWIVATVGLILVVGAAEGPVLRSSGSQQSAVAPATASSWLVPATIAGYHLSYAQSLATGVTYPEQYRMQLAHTTPDGGFTNPVTVMIGDNHLLVADDGAASQTRTTIDLNGQSAEIVEGSISGATVLQYQLDRGDAVVFVDNGDPVSTQTRQLLQGFAKVIKPAAVNGFVVFGRLPVGYKVLAEIDMRREFGVANELRFVDADTTQSLLTIDTEASTPKGYEKLKITSEVEPVKVRGVTGWIATGAEPNGSRTLFWREPSGQFVSIESTASASGAAILSTAELVAIASGLQSVTESEWQTLAHTASTVPITTP